MLGKFLGILDLGAALCIFLFQFGIYSRQIVFSMAAYLLIKAILFIGDALSIVDGIVGIYMLVMMLFNIQFLSIIALIYLGLKGAASLF